MRQLCITSLSIALIVLPACGGEESTPAGQTTDVGDTTTTGMTGMDSTGTGSTTTNASDSSTTGTGTTMDTSGTSTTGTGMTGDGTTAAAGASNSGTTTAGGGSGNAGGAMSMNTASMGGGATSMGGAGSDSIDGQAGASATGGAGGEGAGGADNAGGANAGGGTGMAGASAMAGSGAGGSGDAPDGVAVATVTPTTAAPAGWEGFEATATWTQVGDEVTIVVEVTGCPDGPHISHIHANHDCGADGEAAGGHWVPNGEVFDDIMCADGSATYMQTESTDTWTVGDGSDTDVTQFSYMIHELSDAQNAGAKAACGIINEE